jgi:protein-tyrosine phosphatase
MAAALFAEQVAHVPDPAVAVSSAGLHTAEIAGTGEPPREVVAVMASYGIDLSGHRSRELTLPLLVEADLIIGMSRRHVQEAVLLDPPSWPKAFMLKELVRRGTLTGPRRPDQGIRSWIDATHGDRTRASLAHRSGSDDIPDPYGKRLEKYQATATELSRLTGLLAGLLWPGQLDSSAG